MGHMVAKDIYGALGEKIDNLHVRTPQNEAFRPGIPSGESGWGAKGELSLKKIERLAQTRQ